MTTSELVCEKRPISSEASVVFAAPMLSRISEQSFCDLVHDLRQPLSAIESIAFYLELTVPVEQTQAHHYISRLQQLVADASGTIASAVSQTRI